MRFIDRVNIRVESGAGGNGCVSFRREKYVPRGGPDGGDGGRGGDVVFRVDSHLSTLIDYRYKREYHASDGKHGMGSRMTGRDGETLVLDLPPGTLVTDAATGHVVVDLTEGEYTVARGGRAGRGNARFATPTRRAPRFAEEGRSGEAMDLMLELKLIADVGIVGLPNAGKSTLISTISAARPKVADYPFTTLVPNLGVVRMEDHRGFVVADVPGLIEGAHEGIGLGHQFLRHVERTSVLLHLIGMAPTDGDPMVAFQTVRHELEAYGEKLAQKHFIVAFAKVDLLDEDSRESAAEKFADETGLKVLMVSAATGEGLNTLVGELAAFVERAGEKVI